ncbi:hypothetical protein DUGA2_62760 [Duganella sp. HH101]|nr:hypothetical protein DUGA2_62760 [Duganella sp. HH101]
MAGCELQFRDFLNAISHVWIAEIGTSPHRQVLNVTTLIGRQVAHGVGQRRTRELGRQAATQRIAKRVCSNLRRIDFTSTHSRCYHAGGEATGRRRCKVSAEDRCSTIARRRSCHGADCGSGDVAPAKARLQARHDAHALRDRVGQGGARRGRFPAVAVQDGAGARCLAVCADPCGDTAGDGRQRHTFPVEAILGTDADTDRLAGDRTRRCPDGATGNQRQRRTQRTCRRSGGGRGARGRCRAAVGREDGIGRRASRDIGDGDCHHHHDQRTHAAATAALRRLRHRQFRCGAAQRGGDVVGLEALIAVQYGIDAGRYPQRLAGAQRGVGSEAAIDVGNQIPQAVVAPYQLGYAARRFPRPLDHVHARRCCHCRRTDRVVHAAERFEVLAAAADQLVVDKQAVRGDTVLDFFKNVAVAVAAHHALVAAVHRSQIAVGIVAADAALAVAWAVADLGFGQQIAVARLVMHGGRLHRAVLTGDHRVVLQIACGIVVIRQLAAQIALVVDIALRNQAGLLIIAVVVRAVAAPVGNHLAGAVVAAHAAQLIVGVGLRQLAGIVIGVSFLVVADAVAHPVVADHVALDALVVEAGLISSRVLLERRGIRRRWRVGEHRMDIAPDVGLAIHAVIQIVDHDLFLVADVVVEDRPAAVAIPVVVVIIVHGVAGAGDAGADIAQPALMIVAQEVVLQRAFLIRQPDPLGDAAAVAVVTVGGVLVERLIVDALQQPGAVVVSVGDALGAARQTADLAVGVVAVEGGDAGQVRVRDSTAALIDFP